MCKYLIVGKNAYYSWRHKELVKDDMKSKKEMLKKYINEIYDDSKGTYGSPRITAELIKRGIKISRSYVGRLMKIMGLKIMLAKKFVVTAPQRLLTLNIIIKYR